MHFIRSVAFLCMLPLIFAADPTLAQSDENARVDRLERDLMLLQRQIARGEPVTVSSGSSSGVIENPAQLQVRLDAIEEELRNLRGKVEENEFQARKLNENFDKLQRDVEFRFSEMGNTSPPPVSPDMERKPINAEKEPVAPIEDKESQSEQPAGPTTAGDGILRLPDENGQEIQLATPRDLYNHAFRLLNQTKYEEAADAFDTFTKTYPKDPLIGNAYYWQGETYYIRRDFVSAADNFRQGFEALPDGPKAADNLLKLAMSLDALQRDKEACVVLQQITTKFKKSSTSILEKAQQERKRIGCK